MMATTKIDQLLTEQAPISLEKKKHPQKDDAVRVTLSTLRKRGWTAGLITQFLGEPDLLVPNPHYRSGPPMRLYDLVRAEAGENASDFLEAKQKSAGRVAGARKAVETKRKSLLQQVSEMSVAIEVLPLGEVMALAITSYNDRNGDYVWKDAQESFLQRITVNFIRHHLTSYDEDLEEIVGRVGKEDAVRAIRRKIYDAIGNAYPIYADECYRQLSYRGQ